MDAKLINILNQYDFNGTIKEIKPITVGHINDTFVVEYNGMWYLIDDLAKYINQ
mgnify:CR=1 FL=1